MSKKRRIVQKFQKIRDVIYELLSTELFNDIRRNVFGIWTVCIRQDQIILFYSKDTFNICCRQDAYYVVISGIVDWGEVARAYGRNFEKEGGKIHLNFEVSKFDYSEQKSGRPVK